MHHMSGTPLFRLLEIVVEHRLHIERFMAGSHRQDAYVLFHHHQETVFVNNLHITTFENVVALCLAHRYLHAGLQGVVELCHHLSINLDATTLQCGLYLRFAQ